MNRRMGSTRDSQLMSTKRNLHVRCPAAAQTNTGIFRANLLTGGLRRRAELSVGVDLVANSRELLREAQGERFRPNTSAGKAIGQWQHLFPSRRDGWRRTRVRNDASTHQARGRLPESLVPVAEPGTNKCYLREHAEHTCRRSSAVAYPPSLERHLWSEGLCRPSQEQAGAGNP